ncbi:hypothetical protein C2869_11895 [Saccharobesus litoralis]|uniref:Competence protein ComEA n=1 Tax=Saccharobesus litoralis TaxID=2172099 RepID=A0A2S0VSL0_9ALTE|nr:helix-hairpin-helix domain-containing protein [Saccharobesus litoralis]AWB67090.1 hypothetical protein C2869_11895 [Saccharobesus litoralis]
MLVKTLTSCIFSLTFVLLSQSAIAQNSDIQKAQNIVKQVQQKLDINQVTAEQLRIPKLIGKKRAAAIIAWRDKNGGIKSFDDLLKAKDLNLGVKIITELQKKFVIN